MQTNEWGFIGNNVADVLKKVLKGCLYVLKYLNPFCFLIYYVYICKEMNIINI